MRHLLDTQILIWTLISPERLSSNTRNILLNHEVLVSHISFLEIAIKQMIGKLPEFDLSVTDLSSRIEQDGFTLISLQTEHIDAYGAIPLFAQHRDPFDRILLATALSENMPIISSDANFDLYLPDVQVVRNC
jgi:PIN domain nuclease of toxin-antitoxin system